MRRLTLWALLGLALSGCSRVQMAWRFGPWLMERDAAEELGWPGARRPALKAAVRGWAHQAARTVLPAVADQARLAAARIAAGSDAQAADALFNGGLAAWQGCLTLAVAPAAALLAEAPLDRAAALERSFASKDQKDALRWGDPDHSAVDQAKRLMATFKDYCGEPTDAQGPLIVAWARDAAFPGPAYLAWRRARHRALLDELRGGAQPQRLQALLQDYWLDQASQDKALKNALNGYRDRLRKSLVALLKSLTPDQRALLTQRLEALAQDLGAVVAQAQADPS
jgi:hypothetical protein